jgi:hypothetical protein
MRGIAKKLTPAKLVIRFGGFLGGKDFPEPNMNTKFYFFGEYT